ncbi:hypothetical protein HPB49_022789 [Dermacentor silvarum]|uniref:Uncharacterized protein n=1 Tax=Dermacentor silvarum TaxID=543639 RepID=A0ACB8CTF5_DERSI|nr:hypothetical protein HPB49_022789 [Dermacentor silvarum]
MVSLMDMVWDTAAHILSVFGFGFGGLLLLLGFLVTLFEVVNLPTDLFVDTLILDEDAFGFGFGGLLLFLGFLVTLFEVVNLPTDLFVDTLILDEEYDYVILGGGSAGCVLANRLSADQSKMVLLLEAGGMEDAFSQVPLFAPLLIGGKFDWKYLPEPQEYACLSMEHQRCPWARGMAMGGSSAINFMFYVRGNRRDYDIWRDDFGAHGWSYEDVLPHFRNIETSSVPDHDASRARTAESCRRARAAAAIRARRCASSILHQRSDTYGDDPRNERGARSQRIPAQPAQQPIGEQRHFQRHLVSIHTSAILNTILLDQRHLGNEARNGDDDTDCVQRHLEYRP